MAMQSNPITHARACVNTCKTRHDSEASWHGRRQEAQVLSAELAALVCCRAGPRRSGQRATAAKATEAAWLACAPVCAPCAKART